MRIRTVKPEFWLNEDLAKQDDFNRLFALSLLNYADDEGFFNANPELIRGQVFPFEKSSVRIQRALSELSKIHFVRLSSGEIGRRYGQVVNFLKHQNINRPTPSRIKPLATFTESSVMPQPLLADDSLPEQGSGIRDQGSGIREQGTGRRARAGSHLPAEEASPSRERMIAINALFDRRESTRWSAKEFAAFRDAGLDAIDEAAWREQIELLAWFYATPVLPLQEHVWKRPGVDFRRRTHATLLNNWGQAVDDARAAQHHLSKKSEVEARARN